MSSAGYPLRRGFLLPAVLLGGWAAAIALAPGLAAKAVLAAPAMAAPVVWWILQAPGRWVALFLAAALLLPPLPIAIGDSGPHPCLVLVIPGVLAGILWLGEWSIPATSLNGAMAALFTVLLASVALAAVDSGAVAAAGSLARVALFGIVVYVFFYTAYGPGRRERAEGLWWLYGAAVASALFACVDFYFQFPAPAGYGPQFLWLESGVYRRAQGLFYEASTLGNFCAFFLVMIAAALSRTDRKDAWRPVSRPALLAGGAVFFTAMVLSYSRASLVSLLVACAVLAWRNRSRLRRGRIAAILAVCAPAAAWLTWKVFPVFAETYWQRVSASAERLLSGTESVLSGRVASWRTLADWVAAHPWQAFVGIGYKTLPYSSYVGTPVVADNMYLSLLVETGVFGLAALIWLNAAILRGAARSARAADPKRAFLGTWMLCFWSGQVVQMLSGDLLTYWRVLPLYFWILALAVRAEAV